MLRIGGYRHVRMPITPSYRKWGSRYFLLISSQQTKCCRVAYPLRCYHHMPPCAPCNYRVARTAGGPDVWKGCGKRDVSGREGRRYAAGHRFQAERGAAPLVLVLDRRLRTEVIPAI